MITISPHIQLFAKVSFMRLMSGVNRMFLSSLVFFRLFARRRALRSLIVLICRNACVIDCAGQ